MRPDLRVAAKDAKLGFLFVRRGVVPDLVQEHYIRYLHNGFREKWGFIGNPLNGTFTYFAM